MVTSVFLIEVYFCICFIFLFFQGKPCRTPTFPEFQDGGWLNHRHWLWCFIFLGLSEAHENWLYCKTSIFLCILMKFRTISHKILDAQFDAILLSVTKKCIYIVLKKRKHFIDNGFVKTNNSHIGNQFLKLPDSDTF